MTGHRRPAAWAEWAVGLCLLTWPRAARERDGEALLSTVRDDLSTAPHGSARIVAGECAAVLAAGVAMRATGLRRLLGSLGAGWGSELRQTVRALVRSPAYALTVVAAIGIGVGANAAVLGLASNILQDPIPADDARPLVFVWTTRDGSEARHRTAAPDGAAIGAGVPAFGELAYLARPADGGLQPATDEATEHVRVAAASPTLFDLLGVVPAHGDALPEVQGDATGTLPILLADEAWARLFGRDPTVFGRTVRLDGRAAHVVGVLPSGFHLPLPPDVGMEGAVDVYLPLPAPLDALSRSDGRFVDQDSDNTGAIVARLEPGSTVSLAQRQADRVAAALRAELPAYASARHGFSVRPVHADATAHLRRLLTVLGIGALALLLVTCLNVSSLSLARASRSRTDRAVRAWLGAGRRRELGRHLIEACLLVAAGVGLSLVAAAVLLRVLPTALDPAATVAGAPLSWGTLVGAAAACALSTLVALALPGRRDDSSGLALRSRSGTALPGRLRAGLVVGQIAGSVVLLSVSGGLAREAVELGRTELGFDPEGAVTFALSLRDPDRYAGPGDRARLLTELSAALGELPGVGSVGVTAHLPLSGVRWTQPYGLVGQLEPGWSGARADFLPVSSGYFDALDVPRLAGRTFTEREDLFEDDRVVVVDERLARQLTPRGDVVGRRLTVPVDGSLVEAEIVGVVGAVTTAELRGPGREAIYVPYRQEASREVFFVVRTGSAPEETTAAIREAVRGIDPLLPLYGLRPMTDYVDERIAPVAGIATLVGAFALIVLLSVAVGVHGIVALEVSARTPEIGLRMAVGASGTGVARTMSRRALVLALAGLGLGAFVAVATGRFVAAAVGVDVGFDPAVGAVSAATVLIVTLAASWAPARRAALLDPAGALRAG